VWSRRGRPGVTTTSLIAEQLPVAVPLLEARNGDANPRDDVEVISVTVGGNDLFRPVVGACILASPPVDCRPTLQTVFTLFTANYDRILSALRTAAGDDTVLMTMTYYNPLPHCFIGAANPAAAAFGGVVLEGGTVPGLGSLPYGFNDIIRTISARHGATVAETFRRLGAADFVGGQDGLHPNKTGHTKIAAIFRASLPD